MTNESPSPSPPTPRGPRPPSPITHDPLLGTNYRAIRRLGQGSTGRVLLAEQLDSGQRVVIKLLHFALIDNPASVARLRFEAEALSRVRHRNVVAVSKFGMTPYGGPYIVMEVLRGHTFRDEVGARGVLPTREAVAYVRQALDGLAALHLAGIVHRDIKLSNIFLHHEPDGSRTVKLIDLGVARIVSKPSTERKWPAPATLDQRSLPPPPTIDVGPAEMHSDIHAMAVVLNTLLTGEDPASPRPPVEIPDNLGRVVRKALAQGSDEHFHTAEAFASALDGVWSRASEPLPKDQEREHYPPEPGTAEIQPAAGAEVARTTEGVAPPVAKLRAGCAGCRRVQLAALLLGGVILGLAAHECLDWVSRRAQPAGQRGHADPSGH